MDKEIVRAFSDLVVQVQALGLTHVSHLSRHGRAAFDDDNWKGLAGADFNNYGRNHNGHSHAENDDAAEHVRKLEIATFGSAAHRAKAWPARDIGRSRYASTAACNRESAW
jgi:hypothetical protein